MSDAPEGWHTLTPRIFAQDPERLVSFLREVFGAEGEFKESRPTELQIGDSIIMVSNFESRGSYAACLYVYVSSVEETFQRALSWEVEVVEEPRDTPYGDKRAVITDEWGTMWQIAKYRPG